jgi:hypothetical protein
MLSKMGHDMFIGFFVGLAMIIIAVIAVSVWMVWWWIL